MRSEYDVIIVGAGPAGAACALHLAEAGLRTLILDAHKLPRDKVCGEALSAQSVACIRRLGLLDRLLTAPHVAVNEIGFFAPDGDSVRMPLRKLDPEAPVASIICHRVVFDDLLQQAVREQPNVEVFDWCRVTDVIVENGQLRGVTADRGGGRMFSATAKVVVGADGADSFVARAMAVPAHPELRGIAVRGYYRQVLGLQGCLEYHFTPETLPGYLWIYPAQSGLCNVGLSVPLEVLNGGRMHPKIVLSHILESPLLHERFAFAEPVGSPEVALLPHGSVMREVHGPGYVLLGDAAGLVNPCSSEGIANALRSARIAAQVVTQACAENDTGEESLRRYAMRLWDEIGDTLRLSGRLLSLRTPKAIGSLVRSAKRRPHNAAWLSTILLGSALPSDEVDDLLGYLDFFSR